MPITLLGGLPVDPGEGVVPIMKEVRRGTLRIVGTGFWITRYGLLATAKHVVQDLVDGAGTGHSFVLHLAEAPGVYLRRLRRAHILPGADVAAVQAENYAEKYPNAPLPNALATLSTDLPPEGTPVVTYAYPDNRDLQFGGSEPPVLRGDYFQGGFLRYLGTPENPAFLLPYLETSIEVRPGASGGPVFDQEGRVIGVCCRGWDFRGGELEGDNLSYVVPVSQLLDVEVDDFLVPPGSWERSRIAPEGFVTLGELARRGVLLVHPPLPSEPPEG